MESSEKVYYESWDEINGRKSGGGRAGYIPEGLELVELYGKDVGNFVKYSGMYRDKDGDEMFILVRYFESGYAEYAVKNDTSYTGKEEGYYIMMKRIDIVEFTEKKKDVRIL